MDQNPDIFEQVFCLVVKEYRDRGSHNALGCEACYDNGGFCRKSSYQPLHPFHRHLPCQECSCDKL